MLTLSKTFRILMLGILCLVGEPQVWARNERAVPKSKSKSVPRARRFESGADSEEGWITHQTEKGAVKVRAKQTFLFDGSDVEGQVSRPSQSVFGNRPAYRESTLIPERASFRREFNEISGYSPSTGRPR